MAIPTNIITGFLGVGKTTAITHLLESKPAHERWAVLVNEFGEVGIDGSLFAGNNGTQHGVFIKEVPGGCMCCTAGLSMQFALSMLLATAKPHRLLIEPTGLGHPREVIEILSAAHYRDVISLNSTVTLVDARNFSQNRYADHATFKEQLDVADVIVANKADQYGEDDFVQLLSYLSERYGEDVKPIYPVRFGNLQVAWLEGDAGAVVKSSKVQPPAPAAPSSSLEQSVVFPDCGYVSYANDGEGFAAQGWIFTADFLFDRDKVAALLHDTNVARVKGVFITQQGIIGFNKVDDVLTELTLEDTADSRVELIAESTRLNANEFEQGLLSCAPRVC